MPTSAARVTVPPVEKLSLAIEPAQLFYLDELTWEQYLAISEALPERGNVRVTYDQGRLELMSLGELHELMKYLLGRLVDILSEELRVRGNGFGQMTHRRKDLAKALEPDACYYFKSWSKVRGLKRRIDLHRDPPPDLALEIDVTRSSIPRMPIYERLGVSELWRIKDEAITVYVLNRQGKYREVKRSPTFPLIPIAGLVTFLRQGIDEDHLAMAESFRHWVREHLAASRTGE